MKKADVLIIGAGLTGLTLAYLLAKRGIKALLLEARNRPGGRIHTLYHPNEAPLEMGATWLGKKHTTLIDLLRELNLPIFPQVLGTHAIYEPISTSPPQTVQLPPNDEPSYRIAGGTSALIRSLLGQLDESQVVYGQAVRALRLDADGVLVQTADGEYQAQKIVSTLPPHLLVRSIAMEPTLPADLLEIAGKTHTWMGESIKVALTYEDPFWRNEKRSGTIFSNVGPIPEMYDHANVEDNLYALKGFFNGAYHATVREHRLELSLQQLRRYYGSAVDGFTRYEETVWPHEPFTFREYSGPILPHQHNGHAVFRQSFWDGRLMIAGSETAAAFPGYMDGAVNSAHFAFGALDF
ncbi:flavin monoamine oxidase family protein [Flavilitoribacter nigricans]|uniref:Amine oxidase domain-containing protein n=1 Tax=Flavilitoribacter nigricans (strain ATCC 23147 / DSM 23189 / NBRC 102662 / NCIMB 1420 / SS-2) TaxID=1122177 RepID=A0A2D0MZ03_FLAN2|nr:FAD-dependent oxidoreductase [Flavilitoribacter nigricans]PHN00693.1 hypothetical protein CRP01_40940 [Flavilitoribacter nigricans DSM 23189 = NBRC 102662]